jgi:leukotriene-A4 hydrolase
MGNLATCKTWEDVWLNESPTVFIQRKITEKIYGKERSTVESLIDNFSLNTAITNLADKPGLTKLHLELTGTTPEQAKSNV